MYTNWAQLYILSIRCAVFLAAAHILCGWDRTEGLRAVSDVRAVPPGIQWPVPGGDDAVLDYRLPHTASHTQSHHQLCGLLLQHTQSFVPHWAVPGLTRLLGIETRNMNWQRPQYCVWFEQRWILNVADAKDEKNECLAKEGREAKCVCVIHGSRKKVELVSEWVNEWMNEWIESLMYL